jgi:hypothetical protein
MYDEEAEKIAAADIPPHATIGGMSQSPNPSFGQDASGCQDNLLRKEPLVNLPHPDQPQSPQQAACWHCCDPAQAVLHLSACVV